MAEWAATRAKGKGRYVVIDALSFSIFLSVFLTGADVLFSEPVTLSKSAFTFIFSFLGGLIIGHIGWNDNEKEFLEREEANVAPGFPW